MGKKYITIIIFAVVLIVFSLSAVYYRYVVLKDYPTYTDDYSNEELTTPEEIEIYE